MREFGFPLQALIARSIVIQLPYFAAALGVIGFAILIGGPLLLLAWLQGRLVYPHERLRRGIAQERQDSRIGTVRVRTADGVELTCDYAAPSDPEQATIVLFHGNGDDIEQRARIGRTLLAAGYGVLLAAYRGYGAPGRPSEAGLYADGRAALDFAARHAHKVVVHGFALGSGVAVQLASEAPLAALVLEAPFTSIADVAAARIRWLPTRTFLRDRYDNLAKIGNVRAPTLIYGGSADRVIPPMQFVRLYDAVRAPRRLEVVEGATHDNAWERGGDAHVMHFLAEVLAGVGSASPVVR